MSTTHIIHCDCKNEYQDKQYGQSKRVANQTKKMSGVIPIARCSSCGKEKAAR